MNECPSLDFFTVQKFCRAILILVSTRSYGRLLVQVQIYIGSASDVFSLKSLS